MKFQPTYVFMIFLSRRFLRNWTSGASSDPKVAVAMKHFGAAADVVELELLEL